jgi:hypothetical protein
MGIFAIQRLSSAWPVLVAAFAPIAQDDLDVRHAPQLCEARKSNHSNQQWTTSQTFQPRSGSFRVVAKVVLLFAWFCRAQNVQIAHHVHRNVETTNSFIVT